MLVEHPQTNSRFNIGDTVKIRSTGQIGRIVGVRGGQFQVEITGGATTMVEATMLESRQVLFG